MKIEWSNSLRSDGTRRRPPPNTLHGWLAKMRGTLTGNEELRTRGMREMVDAKRYKDTMRRHAKATGKKGGSSSNPKPSSRSTRSASQRLTKDSRSASYSSKSRQSSTSSRPKAVHRSSHSSSRTMPGAYPAPRPSTQRRNTTKR